MALPISVTYTFATATSAIPLSQLDSNFTTVVNGINGIGNGINALSNVVITGGTIDGATIGATTSSTGRFSTVTATTGNITTINATTLNAATHRSDTSLTFQSNGTTTAMTIDTSQNVGIGTTSPATKLDVVGGSIRVNEDGAGTKIISIRSNYAGLGPAINVTTNDPLLFLTNNTERMRIDSSGRVGVGVSSGFNAQLTVAKTAVSSFTGNTSGTLMVADPSGTVNYFTTLDFTANQYYPIARIASQYTGGGSYMFFGTSNNYTNGVTNTAMTIDPTGNVGIGTSSPATKLQINGGSTTEVRAVSSGDLTAGAASFVRFGGSNSATSGYVGYGGVSNVLELYNGLNGAIYFSTNATEAARIDNQGRLYVGTTSATSSYIITAATSALDGMNVVADSTSTRGMHTFRNPNGVVGSITTNGTATTYATSSDYRLKENIQLMTDGLATVSALKPVRYDWISDNSAGEGFIAHELQAIIPQAVTGEKDAVDEEGNIKPQGVDYSKIVVHLVAAIQELKAELDALKGAK